MSDWQTLIPPTSGVLPGGLPLCRTDPGGSAPAPIAFLGVYPALTRQRQFQVDGTRMNLPVEVERESFASGSASGAEVDQHYLAPLGLKREDVFIFDLVPYYLANTTVNRSSGRSMADNVRLYEQATGETTGIAARPAGEDFLSIVREMPGNLDRLADYIDRCQPRLLLTLGSEPAAFVRGMTFKEARARVDRLFYAPPERVEVSGTAFQVVHLVHPHLFIKRNAKWTGRHADWCRDHGLALVDKVLLEARLA